MKLRRLRVWNWRGLDDVSLEFADDLNLVVGPNESGKSRLVEALHFALFERYKGESVEKRELRSWGRTDPPRVELVFDTRGSTFTLEKQFLKGASAKLVGGGSTWNDEAAEAEIRELFGTREAKGKRDLESSLGLWPLLWVRQGKAQRAPHEDFNDETRTRLRDALSEKVREVATGRLGQSILARVEAERGRFYTPQGRETGDLAAAKSHRDETEAALETARSKVEGARRVADALESVIREQTSIEERVRVQKAALEEAKARLEEAAMRARWLDEQRRECERLDETRRRSEEAVRARESQEKELETLRDQIANVADGLSELALKRGALDREFTEARLRVEDAETRESDAARDHRSASRHASRQNATSEWEHAQAALLRAKERETAAREIEDALAAHPLDDAQVRVLRSVNEKALLAAAALEAASATVRMRAIRSLTVDGEALSAGDEKTWICGETRAFLLDDVAEVVVSPGGKKTSSLRDAARDARRAFEELLATAGVSSLAEAEERSRARTVLEAQRDQARALFADAAPQGISSLEAAVKRAEQAKLKAGPSEENTRPLHEAEESLVSAREELRLARVVRDARREALTLVDQQRTRAEQSALNLRAQAEVSAHRLAALPSESALIEGREKSRAAWMHAELVRKGTEEENRRLGWDDADAQHSQCAKALRARESERHAKSEERARLLGQLETLSATNLHEELQNAEEAFLLAQDRCQRVAKRAAAVKLLHDTLHTARRGAQERLLAPVVESVRPFLQALLPGVELDLDENWSVLGLKTQNQSENYAALSDGAKEQVSILVRLALSQVLGGGESLPMVFDDCLVNTDKERQKDMLRILYRASRKQQIVLFSCHQETFDGLGESFRFDLPPRRRRHV